MCVLRNKILQNEVTIFTHVLVCNIFNYFIIIILFLLLLLLFLICKREIYIRNISRHDSRIKTQFC